MKVEFVLTNPLLVDHFAPIMDALVRRGIDCAFVCTLLAGGLILGRERKRRLHASCVAALERRRLTYRATIDPDADVAITALGSNELHLYRHCKLKLRYGVSLHRNAIHHNGAMTRGFDGMLAHGSFERDLFSRWLDRTRIKTMGYPRHDPHFLQPATSDEVRRRLAIERADSPRVIVYFPTWSTQSSLASFSPQLLELARRDVLLVKPHALSLVDPMERAALNRLRASGARLLGDEVSFAEALVAADVAIADATSGATPEAILLSTATPLVLLTVRTPSELFDEVRLAGPIVSDPYAVRTTVDRLLVSDAYHERRARLKERLFFDQRGHAAETAVDCILELERMPKISAAPGIIERTFPRAFRIARGKGVAVGRRLAAIRSGGPWGTW